MLLLSGRVVLLRRERHSDLDLLLDVEMKSGFKPTTVVFVVDAFDFVRHEGIAKKSQVGSVVEEVCLKFFLLKQRERWLSDFDLLSESILSFDNQATAGGLETPTSELANHETNRPNEMSETSVKKWDLYV